MRFVFISLLFLSSIAWADFKNDLPSAYPIHVEEAKPSSRNGNPDTKNSKQEKNIPPSAKSSQQNSQQKSPSKNPGAFEQEVGNHNSDAPVYFSGKYGEGSRKTGILNLIGDAVIIQDDTTLKSNKTQIFSNPGSVPSSGKSRVEKALAIGNVRIFKKVSLTAPEIKATGEEAELQVADRVLILRGKAKVWRAEEYINADIIEIHLNTGDIKLIKPVGTVDPRSANNTFNNKSNDNLTPNKDKLDNNNSDKSFDNDMSDNN